MPKTCKIDGCNREVKAKGLCKLHYSRYYKSKPIGPLNRLPSVFNYGSEIPLTCKVDGCVNEYYALGYCHKHYEQLRRCGNPLGCKVNRKPQKCLVPGCEELAPKNTRSGLCSFHLNRKCNGISLIRPKGNSGALNVNWKNGVSHYPNHYHLKKNRLLVLAAANYICSFCGGKADRVHHIDKSRTNHSIENLAASCRKCNASSIRRNKTKTSKFIKLYGKTIKEIAEKLGYSDAYVYKKHLKGELSNLLSTL